MTHSIARLVVRDRLGQVGQEILLMDDVTTLGRAASCQVVINYQIDKMVSRLRERIGKEWIETVWGFGYRLRSVVSNQFERKKLWNLSTTLKPWLSMPVSRPTRPPAR